MSSKWYHVTKCSAQALDFVIRSSEFRNNWKEATHLNMHERVILSESLSPEVTLPIILRSHLLSFKRACPWLRVQLIQVLSPRALWEEPSIFYGDKSSSNYVPWLPPSLACPNWRSLFKIKINPLARSRSEWFTFSRHGGTSRGSTFVIQIPRSLYLHGSSPSRHSRLLRLLEFWERRDWQHSLLG